MCGAISPTKVFTPMETKCSRMLQLRVQYAQLKEGFDSLRVPGAAMHVAERFNADRSS